MSDEYICLQCRMETNEIRCPRCKLKSCVEKSKLELIYGPEWENRSEKKVTPEKFKG